MATIWELDFYSRPILDEREKKVWEVLVCESPQAVNQAPETLFRYAEYCDSGEVNSVRLRQALERAIAQAPPASGQDPLFSPPAHQHDHQGL